MAINFKTDAPASFLSAINKAIDDKKIVTWSYDNDGDFTHTPDQWKGKMWLSPHIYDGTLTMNTIPPSGKTITKEDYAVYHGRFIETVLAHFDDKFSNAYATAMPTNSDLVKSAAA